MSTDKPVVKIEQKITGVSLADKPVATPSGEGVTSNIVLQRLNELMKRPEVLSGRTYKLKPPTMDHALYLTINNIVLNPGTPYESHQPFEIFINSKEMESYQWIVALTRLVSAIFRKGGDAVFMIDELKSVFDPNGGYFGRKGRIPSLVAEIGMTLEDHFKHLGLIKTEVMDESIRTMIDDKTQAFVAAGGALSSAKACKKCHEIAVIVMDGCPTCTSCGDSKCG